ncbi:MAG: ATP synthase subunit I [Dokdonella sp.]
MALRTTLLQIGATLLAALIAMTFSRQHAVAALVGGLIIAAGSGLFALRLFGQGVAPARDVLRSVYVAEVLKWLWLCIALFVAIAVLKLPFPGLIAGVLTAQFSFWIALIAIR